ncbi:hypothetical protein F1728_31015 [Gimesia benthica]|uniref:Uncharacterized protein n=1 Tax=Gimesia benthica TaxID=2608982 RepID=A0A6I6ANL3_9PLAN|nr:hypothetical protein [Gimesia benthica]QGQ21203.1 hypothetical protein F1728_00110 [Gimesia benthica]QGQ26835.1 hypothetical protein F1728_31015 [Gimesia benthica]
MKIWDADRNQNELRCFFNRDYAEIFNVAGDAFRRLTEIAYDVSEDGFDDPSVDLTKHNTEYLDSVELTVAAITAYCDTNTSIITDPLIHLIPRLRSLLAGEKLGRMIGGENIESGLCDDELISIVRMLDNLSVRFLNHIHFVADDKQRGMIEGEDRQKKREDELTIEIAERDEGGLSWPECLSVFLEECKNSGIETSINDSKDPADAFRKRYRVLRGNNYVKRKKTGGRPKKSIK